MVVVVQTISLFRLQYHCSVLNNKEDAVFREGTEGHYANHGMMEASDIFF